MLAASGGWGGRGNFTSRVKRIVVGGEAPPPPDGDPYKMSVEGLNGPLLIRVSNDVLEER